MPILTHLLIKWNLRMTLLFVRKRLTSQAIGVFIYVLESDFYVWISKECRVFIIFKACRDVHFTAWFLRVNYFYHIEFHAFLLFVSLIAKFE